MIINFESINRKSLTKAQQDFLSKLIPLALLIQRWSQAKADFMHVYSQVGILPSVAIAEIILESNWGEHPVSQAKFQGKYSNNLTLLQPDINWHGKVRTFKRKRYKAFSDWHEYAVNYTDYLVFSGYFTNLLSTDQQDIQIECLSATKPKSNWYNKRIKTLIDFYHLTEFDYAN